MINFETNYVDAYTINDAWREVMLLCVKNGYDYLIESGSYTGQVRRQLPNVTIIIRAPGTRPLAPILPPAIPPPTDEDKVYAYFAKYIAEDVLEPNEEYTYGSFIKPQLPKIIEFLNRSHGNTNQACICVGDKNSPYLDHAPCLRTIDFKVYDGKLTMNVYFRSWDLFAGMPENLGGLQLLKEYVLGEMEFPVEDGKIIAFSPGLHLYDQYFDLVDVLCTEKVNLLRDINGNIIRK